MRMTGGRSSSFTSLFAGNGFVRASSVSLRVFGLLVVVVLLISGGGPPV
jgi:hypothetical protein